jgi:hypothetical protein
MVKSDVALSGLFSCDVDVPLKEIRLCSIPPYKWSPYMGRILLSDILGRRRPVGFVRESYPIRGGAL